MKKSFIILNCIFLLVSCKPQQIIVEKEVEIYKRDSIEYYINIIKQKDSIINVNEYKIDSLIAITNYQSENIDSLKEELYVDTYKLERIKEYTRIAANGNNIKYLRGWINRTLNE